MPRFCASVNGRLPLVISIKPSNEARYSGVRNAMSSALASSLNPCRVVTSNPAPVPHAVTADSAGSRLGCL